MNVLEFVSLAAVTAVWLEGHGMLHKLMFTYKWIPMKVLRVACHPSQNAPRAENLHEPQLSLVVQEMLEKLLERQNFLSQAFT